MPKPDEVEEAEVNAYMEAEAEKPEEKTRKLYLKSRYEGIKSEYRTLRLAKEEAEQRKDDKRITELTPHFRDNFKARKWAVTSLRAMVEALEDPFIPLSVV
jgi:hypothetical protein